MNGNEKILALPPQNRNAIQISLCVVAHSHLTHNQNHLSLFFCQTMGKKGGGTAQGEVRNMPYLFTGNKQSPDDKSIKTRGKGNNTCATFFFFHNDIVNKPSSLPLLVSPLLCLAVLFFLFNPSFSRAMELP